MQNIKKIFFFLILLIIGIFIPSKSFAETQNLKLEINLEKQAYLIHEPIWLDVTLTNISDDTLRTTGLYLPCQSPFIITVKDSTGAPLKYTGEQIHYVRGESMLMHMGDKQFNTFDILELFNASKHILSSIFGLLPPGRYSIETQLDGTVSNIVMFNIIEPVGVDSDALDIIIEGFNLWKQKKHKPKINKFKEVIDKYSESVYAEKTLYLMGGYPTKAQAEAILETKDLNEEMLTRFPNSGYNKMYIRNTCNKLSVDEKGKFLNKVIKDHPNTRAAKYARQMLKNIKKKRGE